MATSKDIVLYWMPAAYNLFENDHSSGLGARLRSKLNTLGLILGTTEIADYWLLPEPELKPTSEELKSLLTAFAGPHGQTLLKAYKIRRGL